MPACSEWTKGLPQPHATLLISIASSWKYTHAVFTLMQSKGHSVPPIAQPDLARWLVFYRNHRLLTDDIKNYFQTGLDGIVDISNLGNLYGKPESISEKSVVGLFKQMKSVQTNHTPYGEGYDFPLPLAFMVLVWMPCLALYGDYPPVLLRKARHGDLSTICDLIKLDRSVLFDAGISKIIHAWTLELQDVKLKIIGDAIRKGIPHISTKRIKLAWAQYVYDAAKSFGMPLTAPKVRELFDALSQDAGTGPHDPDLAEMTDDAFYQAIAKRKKPLSNILKYRLA